MKIINHIQFPEFTGIKCTMMPFVQGDSSTLPDEYKSYSEIIENVYLKKGEIGFLTIDESFVEKGKSQRGYNSTGINRNVHVEVGRNSHGNRWGNSWGKGSKTSLEDYTEVLVANSISNTCKVWDAQELRETTDGDLSNYIEDYPEDTGVLLKSGEVAKINIFTPHECIAQTQAGPRQFFRIVGNGVNGREDYFTVNPLFN